MTARTLICLMNTEEAKRLNFKILGSETTGPYAGKSLVNIGIFQK